MYPSAGTEVVKQQPGNLFFSESFQSTLILAISLTSRGKLLFQLVLDHRFGCSSGISQVLSSPARIAAARQLEILAT